MKACHMSQFAFSYKGIATPLLQAGDAISIKFWSAAAAAHLTDPSGSRSTERQAIHIPDTGQFQFNFPTGLARLYRL